MPRTSNPNRSSGERLGLVLLTVFIGTLVWSLHSSASKSGINPICEPATSDYSASLPKPVESPTPCCNDKPHLLIGTYYSVKDGLSAKLLLNNKGPNPL